MRALVLVALLVLGACNRAQLPPPEPIIKTVEVKVAVPYICNALQDVAQEAEYPDNDFALHNAVDIEEQAHLLIVGRTLRDIKIKEYRTAHRICAEEAAKAAKELVNQNTVR